MNFKRVSFLLLLAVFSVVLLSACGSDEEEQAGTDNDSNSEEENAGTDNDSNSEEENAGTDSDSNSGEDNTASEEKLYIPIISKGFQHQFWQAVKSGAEQAAEEFDVEITFEGPDDESQVDKQIQLFETALGKDPDAVGFAALDSQASIPLLEQTQTNDIPVVAFDSGVESDIPVTTATTDNIAAAAEAADHMAELIGEEGKVAVIAHDQTSKTGVDRRDGFVNRMEEEYPNIEVVDIQYGGGDHLKSTDAAKAIMQANPDLKGLFGTNEGSAIGVVNAVREMNKAGEITIVGFDSSLPQIEAIKEGIMAGAVTQNPVGIGYETVKAAVEAINGEDLPEIIDTGFYWYDKENIDDPEIQAVIYE